MINNTAKFIIIFISLLQASSGLSKSFTLNDNKTDNNKCAHRLVGSKNHWNNFKYVTHLINTNLATQHYRLEIKAANDNGVWSQSYYTNSIIKHRHFLHFWWFRLLLILLISLALYLLFRWYTTKIRKRNEQLKIYNETLNKEIAHRKKIEQKLHQYNTELERSNKDLEQFAHITSHDLKEPLRIIASFSSLLSHSHLHKLDTDGKQYLTLITQSVQRMFGIIDSLLTYSIVGQNNSVYKAFNLNKLIRFTISSLAQIIKDKNAEIKIGELPDIVGQQNQIGMVFFNLINNALKFNIQTKPVISITSVPQNTEYWKFSIKDNGIGIEPQYYDQIFGILKKLHTKEKYAGTGIGLSICQKIILRHKGAIWLESELGKGTTFFFTIKKNLNQLENLLEDNYPITVN